MFDFNMKLFLIVTITDTLPRKDFSAFPWTDVVLVVVLFILFIIAINFSLRHRINRREFEKKQESNRILSSKYSELEIKLNETINIQSKLEKDNDKLKEINDKLKTIAYYDNLTNLPNRKALIELLDSVMLTLREGESIGLIILNINNFKQINTLLGNSYGDELLIDVTHRLKQVINENDYIARTDGDEFVILSQNISDFEEYDDQIKRIVNVFNYPFSLSTQERFISIRVGVALAPKDGKTTSTILKHANVAMKNAKGRGRNAYIYFDEGMNNQITERIQIQSELRNAFEENEFELYYEPIVSLSNNKIVGLEALVTWNHPTMGHLHPDEYMMHVRDSSIALPIGIWALKLVCSQLKQWEESGYKDINLSYYLSTLEFKEPDVVETIWDIVNKNNISPENITLEISESTALVDIEYTISTINKLKELGIKFCLDKFGTKYSSIKYIDDLSISSIKIDKALSKSVLEGTKEQNTLDAIINLIKTYNLDVIVEGVDRKEQDLFLRKTNCDMAQGHVFSKPLLAKDTFKLLEERYINLD